MSLTPQQKSWILKHPSRQKLTSALNLALKANKISWAQLAEIYSYYTNFKDDKGNNKLL